MGLLELDGFKENPRRQEIINIFTKININLKNFFQEINTRNERDVQSPKLLL
jgi:hypothetical protein